MDPAPSLPEGEDRRILVASDGSPESLGALGLARQLQLERGGSVEVLAVVEPLPAFDTGFMVAFPESELFETRRKTVEERIQGALEQLGEETAGWSLEIRTGLAAATISERAAEWGAHMVVVGLGRHRAVDRIFGTETVLQLLHLLHVPVLAAPESVTDFPRTALVAMDFSGFAYRAARVAAPLLGPDVHLHLAHVHTDSEDRTREGEEWRRRYDREVEERLEALGRQLRVEDGVAGVHLREGDPAKELLELAGELDVDLIVAGSHGHSFMGRLLMGSVSTRLVRGAGRSLLVVPPSASPAEPGHAAVPARPDSEPGEDHPWAKLLAEFLERHAGRRVSLDLEAPEWGARHSSSNFPLLGVDYDPGEDRVHVMLGEHGPGSPHLSHSVPRPRRVEVATDAQGREKALRIDGEDRSVVITLRPAGPGSGKVRQEDRESRGNADDSGSG